MSQPNKQSVWTRPLFGGGSTPGDVQERIARDVHVIRQWVGFWSILGIVGLVIWAWAALSN